MNMFHVSWKHETCSFGEDKSNQSYFSHIFNDVDHCTDFTECVIKCICILFNSLFLQLLRLIKSKVPFLT